MDIFKVLCRAPTTPPLQVNSRRFFLVKLEVDVGMFRQRENVLSVYRVCSGLF